MSDITKIINSMVYERKSYREIPKLLKERNFFIINRFLSKRFPLQSQKYNFKTTKYNSISLDIWFFFLGNKRNELIDFRKWFWSRGKGKLPTNDLSKGDNLLLLDKLELCQMDLDFLLKYETEEIKEELKYFKKLEKQK